MNRIAAIRIAPITALPATAWSAAVKRRAAPVIATAPIAGPAQWRVPPSTLISTTVSGTVIVNTSPTVT